MSEQDWYNNSVDYTMEKLDTSEEGLTSTEAEERLEKYGRNELVETGGISPIQMFLEQFADPMVIILLVAIAISVATSFFHGGEGIIDAIVISAIVIFNAIFGFVQEYRSEKALEKLKEMAAPKARIKREGLWKQIDSRNVVPGDILGLEAGDKIPADARITYAVGLGIDEAVLTGESQSVRKTEDPINIENPSAGDIRNMVFQGTTVVAGKGRAVVTSTGMDTRFGKIAEMVQESEKGMTPLQQDLDDLGKKLGALVIALCVIVFAAEIFRYGTEELIEELMAAIALAVSAIPEGLPAVVTITLAIGVQRMVDRNAIVRRLPSVETLGSTTVICSDKTGTITKNEMTVTKLYADRKVISVSGVGYNEEGDFSFEEDAYDVTSDSHTKRLLQIGQCCSNTVLQNDPSGAADWAVVGDPTEGALLVAAEKAGFNYDDTLAQYKEITEISFDSARKRMTSVCDDKDSDKEFAFMKGAPEVVVSLCNRIYEDGEVRPLTEEDKKRILDMNAEFAEEALRVLAFAYRPLDDNMDYSEPEEVEQRLIFVGLQGMIDPPRDEVFHAMNVCKQAGIRPIMITGDHALTARAVSIEVGLIDEGGRVVTGSEIEQMTDAEFQQIVHDVDVYARVDPEHKLRIVRALRNSDEVVAMTGDGVNDAPAVKQADVGVAMGIRGADVTREASDVVLTDDNFATIVSAVEKGREIYSNIKKFVRFLLAANFDEIFLIFSIIMLGLPLPITPIQILWLNLATDGFPALALGVDPPSRGVMERPPREPGKKMMDRGMISFVLVAGFVAFLASSFMFLWSLNTYVGWIPGITGEMVNWDIEPYATALRHARTAVFASVVTFELIFVWNCRDEYHPIWRTEIRHSTALFAAVAVSIVLTLMTIYAPFMQPLFDTMPLEPMAWVLIILTSLPALLIPPHILFGHEHEFDVKD